MNHRLLGVLFSVALMGSFEQARADLVVDTASRSVSSAATHAVADGGSSAAPGLYIDSATSTGAGPAGGFDAHASQDSLTPATTGPGMFGTAGSTTTLTATGAGGWSTFADSNFMVNFHVDVDGPYSFTASTFWAGSVPEFATPVSHAVVELRDVTNNIALAISFRNFALQGLHSTSGIFLLETGIDYRVTAHTGVAGGGAVAGSFSADSGWSFDVAAVPEASSVVMMMLASVAAAAIAWWKRKK